MTVRKAAIRPRPTPVAPAAAPAAPAEPDTLAAVAARASSAAMTVGGLASELREVAMAAGVYRRTLIREGIPVEMADRFLADWHDSFLGIEDTPDDDDDAEPDTAPA
jgi:hypothetical protein